jgi:hypothetical protein
LNEVMVALLVAAMIFGGAVFGVLAKRRLPGHHLDGDTKDVVRAGVGLLSTLAALVLGLVITTSKGSYDEQSRGVQAIAAKLVELDGALRALGPEGKAVRGVLYRDTTQRVDQVWGKGAGDEAKRRAAAHVVRDPGIQDAIARIAPRDETERAALYRAKTLVSEVLEMRTLAAGHHGSPILAPLLVLLVLWFMCIEAGLNLFAPQNGTIWVVNVVCALSVAGAIFLIIEMDEPFGGLIVLSDAPLRAALAVMGQ